MIETELVALRESVQALNATASALLARMTDSAPRALETKAAPSPGALVLESPGRPPVVFEVASEPPAPTEATLEDIVRATTAAVGRVGKARTLETLRSFGVSNARHVVPEHLDAALAALNGLKVEQ